MNATVEQTGRYRCPGQARAISRSVHLGRLAAFYPACRSCPHRDETGTLSPRRVKQMAETRRHERPYPLVQSEGPSGVYLNEIGPALARKLAASLGVHLHQSLGASSRRPQVVIAGDGRALTPELVAAAGEGLRWAGCDVIELGTATAATLTLAIHLAEADGGFLVGNPPGEPHTVGLRLWGGGPNPLSAGGQLFAVRAIFERGPERPTRRFGSLRRMAVEQEYLARLRPLFHALRPLHYVLAATCPAIPRRLAVLSTEVACKAVVWPGRREHLANQVRNHGAAFGIAIDDDVQQVRLVDECGSVVPAERLALLMAGDRLREQPGAAIVVERDSSSWLPGQIAARGGRPVLAAATRAGMQRAMHAHAAAFGSAGPRHWHRFDEGVYLPDGLLTLSRLLVLLSRSDRPVSRVLDEDAPLE